MDGVHSQLLKRAILDGDKVQILHLLEQQNINVTDDGFTAILCSFIENLRDTFFKLNVRHVSVNGEQRIQVERESAEFVEWMLEKGFNFDCKDEKKGLSALELAIKFNLQNILPALLKHTRDTALVQSKHDNQTLLELFLDKSNVNWKTLRRPFARPIDSSFFSQQGIVEIVRILLERGVPVKHADGLGRTALHYAVDAPRSETETEGILTALMAKGAADVHARDQDGKTPLYYAVKYCNLRAIDLLRENGAISSVITNCGNNLFHAFAEGSQILHIHDEAVRRREKETLDLLASEACDVNARNINGQTPLHLCFTPVKPRRRNLAVQQTCSEKAVKLLLGKGARINAKDNRHVRPLHLASAVSHSSTMKTLLERGAEVNARDLQGKSALAVALASGHNNANSAVRHLLAYGADINDISVIQYAYLFVRQNARGRGLLQHCLRLDAADIPISSVYVVSLFSERLREPCTKEVEELKSTYIDSRTSLYHWLHMDPNRRHVVHNENLRAIVKSPRLKKQFPQYWTVILGYYREAEARRALLGPAIEAWPKLTGVHLPDLCLENIFAHLNTGYLLDIIEEADETRG